MRIEILTFKGCPNAEIAHQRVREAIRREGAHAVLSPVEVKTPHDAHRLKFLGSPSIRIDGGDVEPGADNRTEYGLMCRTYRSEGGAAGAPPIQMIREAIRARLARPPVR
jgi:hypothetical protein